MNIFYLHNDPRIAAKYHCDKHVVKMILESAQMLSTAHRIIDKSDDDILYREAYKNHPSTIWARSGLYHYRWLQSLFNGLGKEFEQRYNKPHNTIIKLSERLKDAPRFIKEVEFSQPPQCMPDIYKRDCSVDAYRAYYKGEKVGFATWKTKTPEWFNEG